MKLSNPWKIALQSGVVFLVFLYYYLQWGTLNNFVEAMDHCERLFCDFYKIFYVMGESIFIDKVPYKGFYYSPFAAILFHFFGRMPRMDALGAWGITQALAILGLYVGWLPAMQRDKFSFKLLYLFLLITAFPLLHNFKWGQVSVLLTLAVFFSILAYQSNYRILSAFFLAFAVSTKYYPVIFILYFIFYRDIKFLVAFALFMVLMGFVIPVVFIGFDATVNFYVTIFTTAEARFVTGGGGALNSQNFTFVVLRLLNMPPEGIWPKLFQVVGYLVVGVNIILAFFVSISSLENRTIWAFLFLFSAIPFFIPTSWPHYFIYLPAFQATSIFIIDRRGNLSTWLKMLLLVVSMTLSNVVFFNLINDRQLYSYLGFLFFSNMLLMLAAFVDVIPQLRTMNMASIWERFQLRIR